MFSDSVSLGSQIFPSTGLVGMIIQKIYKSMRHSSELEKSTTNITEAAKKGIGSRAHEREAVLTQIISKIGSSAFIILQGPAGIGKSAIVEELAYRTAEGVQTALKNISIHRLDINRVVGTGLKGGLDQLWYGGIQQKINQMFSEIITINSGTERKIILWIDEIQDLLRMYPSLFQTHKEALARNHLMIIGATTDVAAITKWLKRDEWGEDVQPMIRRVHRIDLQAPTAKETIEILKKDSERIKKAMNEKFGVNLSFSQESFRLAVALSSVGLETGKELSFPHKAIVCLSDTASYICNKKSVSKGSSITLDKNSFIDYLTTVHPSLKIQIEGIVKEEEDKTVQTRYFPELLAKNTSVNSLIETSRRCGLFFDKKDNENNPCIIGGAAQTAIEVAVQKFACDKGKKLIFCSLQDLIKLFQREGMSSEKSFREVIKNSIGEFGNNLVLLIRDDELLSQARSSPAKLVTSFGNPFLPQASSLVNGAARVFELAVDQFSAETGNQKMSSLIKAGKQLLLQSPQKPSVIESSAKLVDKTTKQLVSVANKFVEPKSPDCCEPHSIISIIQNLLKEEGGSCILATTQSGEIDLSSIIQCPDLTFADSVTCLRERLDWQASEETDQLILKVLYTLQSLTGSEKIELDSALEVLRKNDEKVDREILKTAILGQFQGKKTNAQIYDAWEESAQFDRPFFKYRQKPLINDLHQNLPQNLKQHLNVLIGGKRLLWLGDSSQAVLNLRREQIISYCLSCNTNVATLDTSNLKMTGLSPAIQKLLFQEQLAKFKETKDAVLIMSEEDLSLPFVGEALRTLTLQKSHSIICLAKPEVTASQASESQSLLSKGLSWLRRQDFLPQESKPMSKPNDLHLPLLQMQTMYYAQEKSSKTTAEEFILFAESFLKEKLGFRDKEINHLEEPARIAYRKVYASLHHQYERSLDQIEQDMEHDFLAFSFTAASKALNQKEVIHYLSEVHASKFNLSVNDLFYIVDPNLTPFSYRVVRSLKSLLSTAGHFCTFLSGKLTHLLSYSVSFFFSLWVGSFFRNFLTQVMNFSKNLFVK